MRAGLRALLTNNKNIDVVAEAANLSELTKSMDLVDVLVVMDGSIANPDLANFLEELEEPPALMIVGDQFESLVSLIELPLRAWGILSLEASEDELTSAVAALNQGLITGDPLLITPLLSGNTNRALEDKDLVVEDLTAREMEVLELLSEGLANKQIAYELEISEHTVKFHVSSIYNKLGATNRTEAVTLGARLGIIVL